MIFKYLNLVLIIIFCLFESSSVIDLCVSFALSNLMHCSGFPALIDEIIKGIITEIIKGIITEILKDIIKEIYLTDLSLCSYFLILYFIITGNLKRKRLIYSSNFMNNGIHPYYICSRLNSCLDFIIMCINLLGYHWAETL